MGLSGVVSMAGNSADYCAVLTSSSVDCWNEGSAPTPVPGVGGIGVLSGVRNLTADVANHGGDAGYCALLASGGVDCWGYGATGELGDGIYHNCMIACGTSTPTPVIGIGGTGYLKGVTSMASDGAGYCAVLALGGVDCWGDGLGPTGGGGSATPIAVQAIGGGGLLSGVTSAAGAGANGRSTYCAVLAAGGAACWGANDYGQLGGGQVTSNSPFPLLVEVSL